MNTETTSLILNKCSLTFTDAHAPASLLKLWYRELYDPLIPDELYDECVATEDPDEVNAIINKLPRLNKLVSFEFIEFTNRTFANREKNFLFPPTKPGTDILSSLFATIFSARHCRLHENGFIQFSHGICTELFALYI